MVANSVLLVNVMASNEANNGTSTWDDFRKVTPKNAKSGYIYIASSETFPLRILFFCKLEDQVPPVPVVGSAH